MKTNYAVAPGQFLDEWLEDRGMTQGQAADRLECSRKQVNDLVHGRAPITSETASRLARLTGIPLDAWLRYEALYRADLQRLRDEEGLAQHAKSIHPEAAAYLRALGATNATLRDPGQLVSDFLSFHGCGTWGAYELMMQNESSGEYALAALSESKAGIDPTLLSAWIRSAERGERYETGRHGTYDEEVLRGILPELRERSSSPDATLLSDLGDILSRAGVIYLLAPPPKKLPLYGVTRWVDGRIPVIQLSGRRRSDGFLTWALFHEIGHVLHDPRGKLHVEYSTEKKRTSAAEKRANQFAFDELFGPQGVQPFIGLTRNREIAAAARDAGLSPGVVVHQMHRRKLLAYHFGNDLCVELELPQS